MRKISSDTFFPMAIVILVGCTAIIINTIITKPNFKDGICIVLTLNLFYLIIGLIKLKRVLYYRGELIITPLVSNKIITEIAYDQIIIIKNIFRFPFGPLLHKIKYEIDGKNKNIYFMESISLIGTDLNEIIKK